MFNWLMTMWVNNYIDAYNVPHYLGLSSLTARYSMSNGWQGPLPANQWQKEVEHWFTTSLANLQRLVLELGTGPLDPQLDKALRRPKTGEERLMCRSHVSFSPALCSARTGKLGKGGRPPHTF
jgi:hypothetical protein